MEDVRELVMTTLDRLGFSNPKSFGRCLLCHDYSRVGVRFAFEGVTAIWWGNHVRFVDDAGKLLKVVRLNATPDHAMEAA
jgi:hypothetical protein